MYWYADVLMHWCTEIVWFGFFSGHTKLIGEKYYAEMRTGTKIDQKSRINLEELRDGAQINFSDGELVTQVTHATCFFSNRLDGWLTSLLVVLFPNSF